MFLDTEAMAHARLNNQERFGEGGLGGRKMARLKPIHRFRFVMLRWLVEIRPKIFFNKMLAVFVFCLKNQLGKDFQR